jgi:hypothetical protein
MAAFLLVTMLGWRLFQSIGLTSARLNPAPNPNGTEQSPAGSNSPAQKAPFTSTCPELPDFT